jgi:exopolysaccharide biosynthesis WecB/TagA/CpsF family protein
MLKTCQRAAEEGIPVFLFGGTEELLTQLSKRLAERFPTLLIAGRRASRFRRLTLAEKQETIAEIRSSGALITFVGLGCPRQEVWAYEFRRAISMPVLAVGAAFSFHAGFMPQAPRVLQDHGLEWLYRFAQEPRRLWRRYLLLNPLYLTLIAAQRTGLRRFDPEKCTRPGEEILYG